MNPFPQDPAYLWFLTQSQSGLPPHVNPSFPLPPYNPNNFLARNAKLPPSINPFQQYMYPTPSPQDFLPAYNPYLYQAKLFQKPLDFPIAFAHLAKKDDAFSAETDQTDSLSPHSAGSQFFTKKEDLQPKIEAFGLSRPVKEEDLQNVKLELSGAIPFGSRRPAQDFLRRKQQHKVESPLEQEVRLGSSAAMLKQKEEEILNKGYEMTKKTLIKKKESPSSSGLLKESKKIGKMPKGSPESKDSTPTKQEKTRNKRRLWTSEEDANLLALIDKIGFRWTRIGRLIGGRSGNQVRDRYINNLRPGLSNLPWSEEEDQLLKTLYYILGSRWCCVVRYLPGRSEAQAKNRFYNEVKMQLKPEEEKVKVMKLIINWKNSLKNKQRNFCKQEAAEPKSPAVENFEEILERIYLQNENVYFHPSICFDNIPSQNDGTWDLNEGVFVPKP